MKTLTDLTDVVMQEIMKKQIVLPSMYKESFDKFAKEMDLEENLDEIIAEMAEEKLQEASEYMKDTRQNITMLQESSSQAKTAIKEQNLDALDKIVERMNEMEKRLNKLQSRLYTDTLTKQKNRTWLAEQFLENGQFKDSGTVVFIDINGFKLINDDHGHVIGDKVLLYMAGFISKVFSEDIVVRYGGDEFLIMSSLSKEIVLKRIEKTRLDLNSKNIKSPNGETLFLDFSYGGCEYNKDDIFRDIIELADALMYKHKESLYAARK